MAEQEWQDVCALCMHAAAFTCTQQHAVIYAHSCMTAAIEVGDLQLKQLTGRHEIHVHNCPVQHCNEQTDNYVPHVHTAIHALQWIYMSVRLFPH